jgi:hypothetical protein
MQVRAISTAAAIVLVAFASAACNPATKSKAASNSSAAAPAGAATSTVIESPEASTVPSPSTSVASPVAASSATVASTAAVASAAPSSPAASTPAAAAGGGSTLDVCSLLTPAQASSINGVTYGAATPQHFQAGLDACDYKNNGSADPIDIQDLNTQVISLPNCWVQLEESNGAGVKVPGVGDDAFGYEIGIDVKVGNRCIQVSGLTSAEFKDNYAPDAAMAKIMIAVLH